MPNRAPARAVPAPAPPAAAPTEAATTASTASTAAYALVRSTVLARAPQSAPSALVRDLLARLTGTETADAALRSALGDDLYASRDGHDEEFHRRVVLPLRRDLHNGRAPRAAQLDRLGELPARVPRLAEWLELRERRTRLLAELAEALPSALAAERAALAGLCREPAFRRAVALGSADLLRAVVHTSDQEAGRPGRARKEEAAVLRHSLRATCKTSPLSWFTAVGWASDQPPPDSADQAPRAVVRVNRTLVGALVQALLDEPRRARSLPHRMTSAARVEAGRAHYLRTRPVFVGGRYLSTHEEEVELGARPQLALLASLTETPEPPEPLTARLAAALGRPAGDPAVRRFVDQLLDAGLLVATDPVDPQSPDPLEQLAQWLGAWPEDAALARALRRLADDTAAYASAPAERRPAVLAALAADWRDLLADAGRPLPAGTLPINVLSEDVHTPAPPQPRPSAADRAALAELTALAELFDHGHLTRSATRDRFVARYGTGGVCAAPWEFGAGIGDAWAEIPVPGDLAALRREFTGLPELDGEVVLPADRVRALAGQLPARTAARPLSYSWFVQREPSGGRLCVNHVYGGWGRFTSRFLDATAPQAAAEVARQIREGLGADARAAQVRPVGGFNANLHPLLLAEDIGPDRRWSALAEADLDLVHDVDSDQLRFRLRSTGEYLDVLYLGFLSPVVLPQGLAPLLADHPNGVVVLQSLLPRTTLPAPGGTVVRTPRLRHRHVVLVRRRWHLPAGVLDALRADLAADPPGSPGSPGPDRVPVAAVARWRARLDLPEQVFLHPVARPREDAPPVEVFLDRLREPKPQPVDLGNPLHLRHLERWLARHPHGVLLEEALPLIGGQAEPTRAVELVAETYRPARPVAASVPLPAPPARPASAPPVRRRGVPR
ncbi:lantibiotic dehydratase [Kitasatospora purpeofusca]|uniref:lantibiotic dehydratase n=1 Tax=Kitasatospora purpeofusca TaxID=67352 RepID=UPI0038663EA3|nr:lantibiotic dehydratase family protein [Kitasatospora purpeofusca]